MTGLNTPESLGEFAPGIARNNQISQLLARLGFTPARQEFGKNLCSDYVRGTPVARREKDGRSSKMVELGFVGLIAYKYMISINLSNY
jgi:hypothetical protein